MQICKRRVRVLNARSPGQGLVGVVTPQKAYKHVAWLNLSHIKRVVDVRETPCRGQGHVKRVVDVRETPGRGQGHVKRIGDGRFCCR